MVSIFFTIFLLIYLLVINNKETKVNSIEVKVKVDRFDEVFDTLSESNISNIKKKYPFLFPSNYSNTFWLNKSNDTLYNLLKKAVTNKFKDFNEIEDDMSHFYKHLKYEFPQVKVPRIISVINNVDYENKLILADTLLIISIDSYLGANHSLYDGIPLFVKNGMDINYLLSNIAESYIKDNNDDRTLLSNMVLYGKIIYLNKLLNIEEEDWVIFNTSIEKMKWTNENEFDIWNYFVKNEYFFDTDIGLRSRFMSLAPYSKFNLDIDKKSPGAIGRWLGYKIVDSYMKNNKTNLNELVDLDHYTIFKKSKYKPSK